jgi:dipeptidyl-peptidase-4
VRLTVDGGWHEVVLAPREAGDDGTGGRSWVELAATPEGPANLARVQERGGARDVTPIVDNRPRGDHPYAPWVGGHRPNAFGTLTAEDGQTLHYRLTLPDGSTEGLPLVVHVYGGPGVQRVRREWQPLWPQFLARHGYAVLELDNRGSSGRGRAFEAPIHRRLGVPEVDDQVAGVRELVRRGLADPDRVGVMGHSYGGYMTLRCLTRAPDVFRCGVSVAPVTDWALYDTHYTERYMGLPDVHGDAYAASGVFEGLEHLAGRVLVIHGMADDNVLFTHATQLFHRLQSARIPFEMMTYPGEKHGLATPSTAVHRFRMSLAFLDGHLRRDASA